MVIEGRTVTSKENEEAEGKVAAKWRRNRIVAGATGAELETAAALVFTDEMKAGLDVVYSYEI
jgi:hypothetical protein